MLLSWVGLFVPEAVPFLQVPATVSGLAVGRELLPSGLGATISEKHADKSALDEKKKKKA